MAMIDVVIPVYNQARSLVRCLDALEAQTYRDFQVVIIDDGSTLDVAVPLASYHYPIRLRRQENRGASAARNRGAREGCAPFILFCDADGKLNTAALKTFHQTLNGNPDASFAYSSFYFGRKLFRLWPYDAVRLRHVPYIHTTSLIRREHFLGFDETLSRFQDWDLWLTLAEHGRHGVWINEPLFQVASGGTMSTWLPTFAYRYLPWLPAVRRYVAAKALIQRKHGLHRQH